MAGFTISKQIDASPEAVFAVLVDVAKMPERIPEITKIELLTPGPIGVGSKIAETRVMFGKPTTETFEVTEFEPGKRFTMVATSCGVEYVCIHRLSPDEKGGTQFELEMQMKPKSLVAKLMAPMGWLMKGMMKKAIAKDLDSLAVAALRKEAEPI